MESKFNLNQPIPLLFLGDGPDSPTGLGRIGHDLAWLACSMPEFKVGYLGRQAFGRGRFPWAQYSFSAAEQWGEQRLEEAWEDHSQGQHGIIFTIWDASRLLWFADGGRSTNLENFLRSGRFEKWGYFMADAAGVDIRTLPSEQAHVVSQYQRALMASKWACQLAGGIEGPELDWMPHPINRGTFKPVEREPIRSAWAVGDRETLIGCVMANQQRKHWPVVMEAVARLEGKPKFWIHTDVADRYWNLPALAIEYGIVGQLINDGRSLSDKELAMRYAACDLTLVISGGEGFCYPVVESLSCGTPVVAGAYGAQADLTPWCVQPVTTVIDTRHSVRRAVYRPVDVAEKIAEVLAKKPTREQCTAYVEHLDMIKLGVQWKRWFRRGLV